MKMRLTVTKSGKKLSQGFSAPIKCAHCGHKIELKLSGLKSDPLVTCPACHKKTQIDSGGSLRKTADSLAKIDRAWENLLK